MVVAEYILPNAKVRIVDDAYRDATPEEIARRQEFFDQTVRCILTNAELRLRKAEIEKRTGGITGRDAPRERMDKHDEKD